ncbi:WecB/TagA/CpsF family glycosyltransferase [Candidatus Shapirobacteria bacterium]|nr:WecB/TagA/CpsF family glycosyltransferase [Candidatus Shapirobacteria bacterium]
MKKAVKNTPKKDGDIFKIFQIELISNPLPELLGLIEQRLTHNQRTFIVTPNPEFMVWSFKNPWFKRLLIQSDIAIPDGVALFWAKEVLRKKGFFSRLFWGFGTGLKVIFQGWGEKRISGTDLTEKLCQLAARKNWTVYFLGGRPGIAQKTLKILQKKYPGLRGWAESGPKLEMANGQWLMGKKEIKMKDTSDGGSPELVSGHDSRKGTLSPRDFMSSEVKKWVEKINQFYPDLLFVAFGMGKQEKFIADNWGQLKIKLGMGIGGAFDYLSGEVKRAPQWIQKIGLEWSYRLLKEPWRWKRQLSLLKFIWLVLKKK